MKEPQRATAVLRTTWKVMEAENATSDGSSGPTSRHAAAAASVLSLFMMINGTVGEKQRVDWKGAARGDICWKREKADALSLGTATTTH